MKVFKFGGASVNSVDRIKNVASIIEQYRNDHLMIIISAMGKTTNALEKVAEAFFSGKQEDALSLFDVVKQNHLNTAKYLLVKNYNETLNELVNIFTEVEWLLHDKPVRHFDYYYDQIVCVGELLSTCIMSAYLNETGIANNLIDVRDILRTDDNFRDAGVDWDVTSAKLNLLMSELHVPVEERSAASNIMTNEGLQSAAEDSSNLQSLTSIRNENLKEDLLAEPKKVGHTTQDLAGNHQPKIFITQGFIGSTDANESTTLGREGSDYSAAIFANLLRADSLTIWKDVEGVMSADPKEFSDAVFINQLSYTEVIEMAYYGAQVIHPKTIKPLQNKHIPLLVKSFIDPALPGTVIGSKNGKHLPPIKVIKQKQVLIQLHSQDFSFVGEHPISQLYKIFEALHIKPNLLQTGAISILLGMDDHAEKIDQLAQSASDLFNVQIEKELTLLTIRHFTDNLLEKMLAGKTVVLMQKTSETVQALYR